MHTPRRLFPVKTGRLTGERAAPLPTDIELKKAETKQRNDHMRDGTARRLNDAGTFDYGGVCSRPFATLRFGAGRFYFIDAIDPSRSVIWRNHVIN